MSRLRAGDLVSAFGNPTEGPLESQSFNDSTITIIVHSDNMHRCIDPVSNLPKIFIFSAFDDIDANEDIYLLLKVKLLINIVNLSVDEVTLAQALAALKSEKPKADKVVIQEPKHCTITTTTDATTVTAVSTRPRAKGLVIHVEEQATTPTVSSQQPSQVKVQDKGKGIMVEEPLKMKKKDQINCDEQEAKRLQAEFDKEERLAREKAQQVEEANIACDDIQVKVKADYQLAQRLQAQEQEDLSDAEKATLFVQLLEKRRKYFAAKRAEEKRNRLPTKAQQRIIMCTYLKNMKGWKPKT
ncbi:hypothetical protein Tco_1384752 [Tanacetum coccineum]